MATLRNKKRKLAAVSRKTPESSRSGRGPTVLDPELTQDYISQVSEETERRVTKKLSKEFSKTEPRILGALSKLDEFLLYPRVRTCSVAVQGLSGNANSENRETHGVRSSNDPCRSTPARHAANLHRKESHPMLRRNSNIDWTFNITLLCISTIVHIYGYVNNTYL